MSDFLPDEFPDEYRPECSSCLRPLPADGKYRSLCPACWAPTDVDKLRADLELMADALATPASTRKRA